MHNCLGSTRKEREAKPRAGHGPIAPTDKPDGMARQRTHVQLHNRKLVEEKKQNTKHREHAGPIAPTDKPDGVARQRTHVQLHNCKLIGELEKKRITQHREHAGPIAQTDTQDANAWTNTAFAQSQRACREQKSEAHPCGQCAKYSN